MQGQVYVTVEAAASEVMLMSAAGSEGEVKQGVTIHWHKNGGVSGSLGWPGGMTIAKDETPDVINGRLLGILNAMEQTAKNQLIGTYLIGGCADYFG